MEVGIYVDIYITITVVITSFMHLALRGQAGEDRAVCAQMFEQLGPVRVNPII